MQAVLFDMDGVIVDSERYWVELEEGEIFPTAVASEEVSADEITGMNYREVYDYLADHYEMAMGKEAFIERYERAAESLYAERVALMNDVPTLLADLRDRRVQIGLVSSSPLHWIETVLDRFALHDSFDLVVSADRLLRANEHADGPTIAGKPEPDVYLHAASELNVDPTDCVVVEDSVHGVRAGAAAGMHTIGYRTDDNHDIDLSVADEVVVGPEALRSSLLALTA